MKKSGIRLRVLPDGLSVCKVASISEIDLGRELYFIGRTADEISLVTKTEDAPASFTEREDGWRGFYIDGVLDFSLIGILSGITGVLAEAEIGIFAVSTYNTDYILVKEESLVKALRALKEAGYTVDENYRDQE